MPEHFTSQITVDRNIVSLLSKFTYERSFPYGIREVISNAYDADATVARITIDLKRDRIVIYDNGNGMTRQEFEFYLRIAGQRRGKRETPKFGRKRIGQFGVGFLAILPFCETLQIRSTTENSDEVFSADIPAAKFFKRDGKAVDVGEVDVPGEVDKNPRLRAEHFTEISLIRLTDLATRYLTQKPQIKAKERVTSWLPMDRLKWELQEDLPLTFPEASQLNDLLAYPEPIGMEIQLQGERLYRNYSPGEIIDSGQQTLEGITFRYAIISPWKGVKPFELRGLKVRLNNVGVGARQVFGIGIGRKYSRLHWLSGELQIVSGLDGAITLSRDAFVTSPEYEGLCDKAAGILRKWADYVEQIDVAARDMTKHLRGGKQVSVGAKKTIVEKNIRALTDRGFSVTRLSTKSATGSGPVHVDREKREVIVYEGDPGLQDTVSIGGRRYQIIYIRTPNEPVMFEQACRLNRRGELEINTEYPLFKSKRYGDIFKKIYIIAVLAKTQCSSPEKMHAFLLSQIEHEFKGF